MYRKALDLKERDRRRNMWHTVKVQYMGYDTLIEGQSSDWNGRDWARAKTAMKRYQLLQQAYGEDAIGRTQVFDWYRRFKEGRTSDESEPRSGPPSTSRKEKMIATVRTTVGNDRRMTVREIADDCGISMGSCNTILTDDLHMKSVCAKVWPRLLKDDQREQSQSIAGDLLESSCEDVQFLKYIVTGDENWVYGYDPETKRQSSQ